MTFDPLASGVAFDGAQVPGSAWCWDVVTGKVSWSEGIDALFGLPPGAFGGSYEAYLALVHPDDRAHFQALIARTLEAEDAYVMSHRVLWPDGSVHWIDGRGRLTRAPDGRPLRLDGVVWDASARRLTEARIRHLQRVQSVAMAVTKELLRVRTEREVLDAACRIAVEHGHFRFAYVGLIEPDGSARAAAWSGVEDGYLQVLEAALHAPPASDGPVATFVRDGRPLVVDDIENAPNFAPWRAEALRRGYRSAASLQLRRAGKIVGWLAIYADEPNRFDFSQIELLLALAEDIGFTLDAIDADARRHAAEDALRRSEERFRALFELASEGIFVADHDDRIVGVNPAGCAMTGFSIDELRGTSLADLRDAAPADEPARRAPFGRWAGEDRVRRKDGTSLDVEVSTTLLAGGSVQAFVRDVGARKRVQEQLVFADRLTSLGRLAAGVAHEVNNPLTYVLLSLQRLEQTLESVPTSAALEDVRSSTAMARDGAERVRAIVRALATFGREEDASVAGVDLHHVIDAALRLAENRARHQVRILKAYGATRAVRGSELRLTQVFLNLVVNAVDALRSAAPDTSVIEVRTYELGEHVVAEVKDNGTGIPQHLLGRIFDPFFTTKPVGEGTGLGLSICHSIVGSFGGSIAVESRPGEGSTFRVVLHPAVVEKQAGERPPRPAAAAVVGARVLIVDDEPRILKAIASMLPDSDVTTVASGAEALELCASNDYDCVVCDLMMPGVSGMELHEELVRMACSAADRMVFITGGAFTVRARHFLDQVRRPVLEKPFTSDQLVSAVRRVLGGS